MGKDKLFLIIFGLSIFAQEVFVILNSKLILFSDEAIYASFARFWYEGDWNHILHPFWPPLYPLFSSLVFRIIPNWEIALRIVSSVASAFLIIPVYIISKKSLGFLGTILIIISFLSTSSLYELSIFPLSDMTAVLFSLLGIAFVKNGLEDLNCKNLTSAGIFLGLSYLSRSEGLMFFTFSLFYLIIIFSILFLKRKLNKKLAVGFFGFILAFTLIISPYVLLNSQRLGFVSFSPKFSAQIQQGQAFEIKNGSTWAQEIWSVKNPNYSSKYFQGSTNYILENFSYLKHWFLEKSEKWFSLFQNIFPKEFLIISLVGACVSIFNKNTNLSNRLYLPYLLLLGIPVTVFSTSSFEIRYFIWIVALFIYYYYNSFSFFKKNQKLLLFIGFVVYIQSTGYTKFLNPLSYATEFTNKHFVPEVVEASNWLGKNSKVKNPKLYGRHESFEFYSNGQTIYIPQGDLASFENFAKKFQVDYIIAWKRELAGEEDLLKLTNNNYKNENFNKVFQTMGKHGNLLIYELKK